MLKKLKVAQSLHDVQLGGKYKQFKFKILDIYTYPYHNIQFGVLPFPADSTRSVIKLYHKLYTLL